MAQRNIYSGTMTLKSDAELLKVIGNPKSFLPEAREAAINELTNRQFESVEFHGLKTAFNQEKQEIETAKKAQERHIEIPEHKPQSITKASYFIYASIAVGLLKSFFAKDVIGVSILESPTHLVIFLITIGVTALFGYMIGLGKNWARITFLTVFIFGLIGLPFTLPKEFAASSVYGLLTIGQYVLQLAALVLLFGRTTKAWYNAKPKITTPNTH